jgi:hypothetical protein
MAKKLIPVEIKRSRWLRGRAPSYLRNEAGKQCCLGFVCRQAGWKAKDLVGRGMPAGLYGTEKVDTPPLVLRGLVTNVSSGYDYLRNSDVAEELASINDEPNFTPEQRETALTKLAKKAGLQFIFVD